MAKFDYDFAVIGGGSAGLSAAAGAGQLGARTLLMEREPRLGGDCLHTGCVPSKALIASAEARHALLHAADFGLAPVTVPKADFSAVAGRIREVVAAIQPHDSPERFARLGVETLFGQARFVDEHQVEVGGERISAARWLVATGSSPSVPPIPGLDQTPHITNVELFRDLDTLPGRLLVLGGGPIACEMAQAFARLGSEVVLVQRSEQILSRDDPDMAEVVARALAADGVDLRLGTADLRAEPSGGGARLTFTRQGRLESVEGDVLLVALGRRPNVEGMGLSAAGVEHSSRGIAVDARMRTSQKHIFAAGDVTGAWQFTHAAGYEASIVVSNAILRLPRKANYDFMPACTYTRPELATIGLSEEAAKGAGLPHTVFVEEFAANDRALASGAGAGRIKLVLGRRGRPLGVQIAGPGAGELLAEWVAVLGGGVGLSTLASLTHPYPTLAEINKRVAARPFSAKLFSPMVRRVLRLVLGYRGPGPRRG